MLTITLRRLQTSVQGTFGVLELPGRAPLCSAELPWRGNRRRVSCIPPGAYRCGIVSSPRFGRTIGVHQVPGRSNILMHAGNLAGDAEMPPEPYDTHSQGCILVGSRFGLLRNSRGRWQRAVVISAPAVRDLLRFVGDADFMLLVMSIPPAAPPRAAPPRAAPPPTPQPR